MKKMSLILAVAMVVSLLAGCAGTPVVYYTNCTCPTGSHTAPETPAVDVPAAEGAVKTGLAIIPSIAKSTSATAEANGKAEYDVTIVAVTVDENGVVYDCVIDSIGATSEFTAEGVPVKPGTTEVKSKNELGFDYGMVAYNASAIGKEWFEQADALAQFAVGKNIEEVKGSYADDVDLATSASIYLGGYVSGIEAAVANAQHLGAQAGDELKLAVTASLDAGAGEEAGGTAQLNLDAAAVTMNGDVITSCTIDSLQAAVTFDGTGAVGDLSTQPKTKNQLGFDYGMVAYKASGIGKEWFEQAAHFCAYVVGKTPAEVAGIAVDEGTKPTDADLSTGCTIAVGGFQKLIAKAAQE